MTKKNRTVALLVGGASAEREVSKHSSEGIYQALLELGYTVKLIDPAYGIKQPINSQDFFTHENHFPVSARNYLEAVNSSLFDDVDIAFLGLHGEFGEDGIIQSLLELRGINYTGSGVAASSLTMDKMMSKLVMRHHHVSVPEGFVVDKNYSLNKIVDEITSKYSFPLVVKPNDQGSTFGLSICEKEDEIVAALDLAFRYTKKVLVEEFIPGRELTVGVLGNQVLPVLEIRPKHALYDYECKYTAGMSEYICPADIPENLAERIKAAALQAFAVLGCSGYARIDFRLNAHNEFYCLEVNSLPGMTSTSLLPKAAKAIGISFTELVDTIISLALL